MARYIDYDKLNEWVEKQNCDTVMCDNRHCIECYIGENGYEDIVEIEKRVPKMPIIKQFPQNLGGFKYACCPTCECTNIMQNYCPKCGQALDWSV